MYRLRPANLLATILGTAGLLAGSLAPIAVGPVVADHGGGRATASATLACFGNAGLPADACVNVNHESPAGVHAWSVTDARTVNAGGSSMAANPEFSFDETYGGGTLVRAVVRGHMTVSLQGGGSATADANYSAEFVPIAGSYSVTGQLTFTAGGSGLINSSGGVRLNLRCGTDDLEVEVSNSAGAGEPLTVASTEPVSGTVTTGDSACVLEVSLSAGSGTNQPAPASQAGSADAELEITITSTAGPSPTPESCSISGDVSDTDGTTRPSHALPGVRVELLQPGSQGGAPLVAPVAANSDGTYCFRLPSGFTPVDAVLRATLMDFAHQPSLFKTRHASSDDAVAVERSVSPGDFGRTDIDIDFMPTPDRQWLADVATIHYESERFMSWVIDDLGLAPGLVGPVDIRTGADRTNYTFATKLAQIAQRRTPFEARSGPDSVCPENCEWHELAHHIGDAIGLALTFEEPACAGRTSHGGWSNPTTCDSLAEGFASFLATLASLDIDATLGPGYATPNYSTFGSLEDNGLHPWSFTRSEDGVVRYDEDHAVAQLLWDLADPASAEHEWLWSAGDASDINPLEVYDRVDLGGRNFVHLLAASQADTVMGLYEFLAASPSVPADLKVRDPGFPDALAQDITPLQEAFLLHRFYPVPDPIDPATSPLYHFGDTIGRTDRPASAGGAVVERREAEEVTGSEIRLVNAGMASATFMIDVEYPGTASHLEIVVAPESERLVHVEVPAPWPGIMRPEDSLPACSATPPAQHRVVTVTVTAPGGAVTSLDNCAYLHAVATTTTGYAMNVGTMESAEAADSTVLLLIGVGAAGALLLIGALLLVRRRKTHGSAPEA